MALFKLRRSSYVVLLCCLFCVALVSACGSATSAATTTSNVPTPTSQAKTTVPPAAATAQALAQLMSFVGQPTAKIVSGTTFEVDGMVNNGDSKQHDIYIKVALLDASANTIASAIKNVDNVAGGVTVSYKIQGTTTQPTWAKVVVTVNKVTENTNGSGSD